MATEFHVAGVGAADGYAELTDGTRFTLEIVLCIDTLGRSLDKLRQFPGKRMVIVHGREEVEQVRAHLGELLEVEVGTVRDMMQWTGSSLK